MKLLFRAMGGPSALLRARSIRKKDYRLDASARYKAPIQPLHNLTVAAAPVIWRP
jgi:hypothetical protein